MDERAKGTTDLISIKQEFKEEHGVKIEAPSHLQSQESEKRYEQDTQINSTTNVEEIKPSAPRASAINFQPNPSIMFYQPLIGCFPSGLPLPLIPCPPPFNIIQGHSTVQNFPNFYPGNFNPAFPANIVVVPKSHLTLPKRPRIILPVPGNSYLNRKHILYSDLKGSKKRGSTKPKKNFQSQTWKDRILQDHNYCSKLPPCSSPSLLASKI